MSKPEPVPQPRAQAPMSERLCDLMIVTYATWTLCSNLVVFLGQGLRVLVPLAAISALATGVWTWKRSSSVLPLVAEPKQEGASAGRFTFAAGGALALCALYLVTSSVILLWWGAVLFLGMAFFLQGKDIVPARRDRRWEIVLMVLAGLFALFPLFVHWANADDVYYINVATAAVDRPGAALLAEDTLHGIPGLPIMLPVYRVISFELLAAAIAYVSPLSAIESAHWVVPALFAFFLPLCTARLCKLLTPRTWLWSTLGALVMLAFIGEPHRWYGMFSLLRLHQGKGVFIGSMVPLLVVYGAVFARTGRPYHALLLFAVQVSALGMTATAIWAAPVLTGLALLANVAPTRSGLVRLALGVSTSAYLVAVGLFYKAATTQVLAKHTLTGQLAPPEDPLALVPFVYGLVAGEGLIAMMGLFALFAAWGLCRGGLTRRLVIGSNLGILLVFLNPYVAPWVSRAITGEVTFFRSLWLLPLPTLLGLVISAPFHLGRWRTGACVLLSLASGTALIVLSNSTPVINPARFVRIEAFGLKVPLAEYDAAARLVARVPPRSHVLAPEHVSHWVGTFPEHPYALLPRVVYLRYLKDLVPDEEIERRWYAMAAFARRTGPLTPELVDGFTRGLDHYSVEGVCLQRGDVRLGEVLSGSGFERVDQNEHYEIWCRR